MSMTTVTFSGSGPLLQGYLPTPLEHSRGQGVEGESKTGLAIGADKPGVMLSGRFPFRRR